MTDTSTGTQRDPMFAGVYLHKLGHDRRIHHPNDDARQQMLRNRQHINTFWQLFIPVPAVLTSENK